jgi:hypothetical protein
MIASYRAILARGCRMRAAQFPIIGDGNMQPLTERGGGRPCGIELGGVRTGPSGLGVTGIPAQSWVRRVRPPELFRAEGRTLMALRAGASTDEASVN